MLSQNKDSQALAVLADNCWWETARHTAENWGTTSKVG